MSHFEGHFEGASTFLTPKLSLATVLKGIGRSFELRGKIRLIRSVMTKWRLGNFFSLILNGLHHKISKKPIVAA